MSLIPYLFRRFSTTEKRLLEIGTARTVKSTKNLANILEIEGIEGLKKGDIISAGLHKAWVFALYRDYSLAAILSDQSVSYNGEVKLSEAYELKVANSSKPSIYSNILTADVQGTRFKDFLKARPPYKHLQNSEQLMTGYQQIDICQPLSLGHSILFYGKSHKGKLRLAYQTAELFSRRENSKVVIVSPNPLRSKNHLENVIFYSASTETSEISQYLMPYVALNHACTLRDQGFDVLFILDDVIFHAFKEKSLFPAETLIEQNLGSLIFEHSKCLPGRKSLTSIVIFDEDISDDNHRKLTAGLQSELMSMASQTVTFASKHKTIESSSLIFDFIRPVSSEFPYQLPIFQALRRKMMKIFQSLHEISSSENMKEKHGIKSEPWDKYLLLDSNYFIPLLCQDSQTSIHEIACFVEFVVFSIENELISMFKIEMNQVRKEFFKFLKTCSTEGINALRKDPKQVDVEAVLTDIDKNVIKHFYIECKMQGWLKEFQDDYEDLFISSSASSQSTLKTEVKPELAPQRTGMIERLFKSLK